MKRRVHGAMGVILILAVSGTAKFAPMPQVPVERLIANTTAYIKEHPEDAMGPYTLARIHYLALATRTAQLAAREQQPPASVDDRSGRVAPPASAAAPGAWTEQQLREHLALAVENYRKALQMESKSALFHLGLASVSEAALSSGLKLGAIPGAAAAPAPANGRFHAAMARAGHCGVSARVRVDNQDGISQAGEVIPIENTGIESLAVNPTGRVGASLANAAGLQMRDGRVLPTYDWTTEALRIPKS